MLIIPDCCCQVEADVESCYELNNVCESCPCDACSYAKRLERCYSDFVRHAYEAPGFTQHSVQIIGDVFWFIQAGLYDVVCENLAKPIV